MRPLSGFTLFGLLIGCGGDGAKEVPVSGTVTLDDRPLGGWLGQNVRHSRLEVHRISS